MQYVNNMQSMITLPENRIQILIRRMQIFIEELAQYKQSRVNAENEDLAMSCGAFNPRFLAKIKRSKTVKTENRMKKKRKKTISSSILLSQVSKF